MMLVEHDVEAELVGQEPFVVEAMIEIGRDLRDRIYGSAD